MENHTRVLSSTQIESFHEFGFLVVDFGLDEQLLDALVEKTQSFYDLKFQRNPTFPSRIIDGWKLVDEARKLATDERIKQALKELFGRDAKPFQTLNFPFGTCQAPHSDTIHFNSIPNNFMAGVWVALEDIEEDNGPLIYYPGSHKLPEITMQQFGLEARAEEYPKYEILMREFVEREGLKSEYGIIGKGKALIWHANLLHGGEGHWNLEKSRHSQVTHYYFADCKYYTPMLSEPDSLYLRDPQWIPNEFDDKVSAEALAAHQLRREQEIEEEKESRASGSFFGRLFKR